MLQNPKKEFSVLGFTIVNKDIKKNEEANSETMKLKTTKINKESFQAPKISDPHADSTYPENPVIPSTMFAPTPLWKIVQKSKTKSNTY